MQSAIGRAGTGVAGGIVRGTAATFDYTEQWMRSSRCAQRTQTRAPRVSVRVRRRPPPMACYSRSRGVTADYFVPIERYEITGVQRAVLNAQPAGY